MNFLIKFANVQDEDSKKKFYLHKAYKVPYIYFIQIALSNKTQTCTKLSRITAPPPPPFNPCNSKNESQTDFLLHDTGLP